jgi:hypothetical protein
VDARADAIQDLDRVREAARSEQLALAHAHDGQRRLEHGQKH